MTMPPNYSDRQSSKMSSGKKTFIGCGIGCAVIIGIVLIVVGFAGWWFFSAEDQVPTDKILNPDSSAVFKLENISKSQEVIQLISDVLTEARRINQNRSPVQFPESLDKFQKFSESQKDLAQFVKMFTPEEATLSMSLDKEGDPVFTVAANFDTGTRLAKSILKGTFESNEHLKSKKISTEHGDLFLFDDGGDWNGGKLQQFIVGFYGGTFILSSDRDAAVSALGQLAEESNAGTLNEALSGPYNQLSREGSLAYGVLDSSFFENPDHAIGPFKGIPGSEIKKAEISLDSLSSEKGTVNLHIDLINKEAALKAKEEIEKLKTEWIKKAEQNGFKMEVINSIEDEKLDIKFQVNNLKESLVYLMQNID